MSWTLLSIILAAGFFVATVVLALKLDKKKKPVWACNTRRIIGLGTDAPAGLKITLHGMPVDDVYRTVFIFFNKGREPIRRSDVADSIAVHFEGANILREPTVLATRREANRLSVRQVVKEGQDAIELSFSYLDHGDGIVVEVLHSRSEKIRCSGTIVGAEEIAYIGEFLPWHPPRWLAISYAVTLAASGGLLYVLFSDLPSRFAASESRYLLAVVAIFVLFVIVTWVRLIIKDVPTFYRYARFPKWTGRLKLPLSEGTKRH